MALAREQQRTLKDLMARLFDKSLEGLHRTKHEVDDLRKRHHWYHSNIYQLHELKGKISSIQTDYDQRIDEILKEIRTKKAEIKNILHSALDQLETIIDKNLVKQYLDQLLDECDKLFEKTPELVLLGVIFGAFGFFAILAAIIGVATGSAALGPATLGLGAVVSSGASEAIFRKKLRKLGVKLANGIATVQDQKNQNSKQLDSYFDDFVQYLCRNDSSNSTVHIVWFDENIRTDENQSFANRLSHEFSSGKYQLIKFDQETAVIQFVRTMITNNIILITSGSAGHAVISKIGYYWNLKGIIIFCIRVDDHRLWAGNYKKLLLVTDSENEVIEKIKHIESGEIYFLMNGLSLEDVRLKLQNVNYYFSTKDGGFMIQDLKSINSALSYHRNIMEQLHQKIVAKKIYPNGIPEHFVLKNLYRFVDEFLEALKQKEPEWKIIHLYTKDEPYYYKIVNDILNRLDEELIHLIDDYIKALRYALINYIDTSDKTPTRSYLKLYRGLCLKDGNSLKEFQRKFRVADIIIFPSFASTSLDKETAESFTNGKGVLLEITADCTKKNKPKNISAASYFKNENELLLNCFNVLKVVEITKISDNLVLYRCTLQFHLGN